MNLRAQVFNILKAGTTGLVANRVYGKVAPQNVTTPYIKFQIISDVSNYTHAGPDETGMARVQTSCYSTSYEDAANVASAVITALNSAPRTYGVGIAQKANELDLYEEDTKLYHIPVDFMIGHTVHSTTT